MSFSITNRPRWAIFDAATGRLSGTPTSADEGTYANIAITASDGSLQSQLGPFEVQVEIGNRAPQLEGTPPVQAVVGAPYSFRPTATDADGDTLTFSISNRPAWAAFDSSTGELAGTPTAGDEGRYDAIVISVSDGSETASLAPFSIDVQQVASGSLTLNWLPPTENTDGSPLTDLAGYRFYWGTSSGAYTSTRTVDNPGLSTYVLEGLAPGTYFLTISAVNSFGVESSLSNEAVATVGSGG